MRVFVIMPFTEQFDEVYKLFIAEALKDLGFEFQRADDIQSQQNILKDIVEGISKSDLIIADLSNPNPNVYYELGLAHALNKPVVSLTQNIGELPFDLQSYRVIEYDIHFAKIRRAKEELRELLKGFKKQEIPFSNPVMDFLDQDNLGQSSYSDNEIQQQDFGFIDHIVEIENSFKELSELALSLSDSTEIISERMEGATGKIKRATADGADQAAAIRIKRISKSLASDFDEYSSIITESNIEYKSVNSKIKSSLDFIFNFIDKEVKNIDKKSLKGTKADLVKMEDSLFNAKDSFEGFMNTLEDMPEVQADLKKSIKKTVHEQDVFLNNMDQTLSTLGRTIRLIDKILSKK